MLGLVQCMSLFEKIQLGLWLTSIFGSCSVWFKNGSKLSRKTMVTKCEGK